MPSTTIGLSSESYLGYSFPPTEDQGLAIVALTYAAGRFPRLCLFKLSKEGLETMVLGNIN
jgi:hypothetical protein